MRKRFVKTSLIFLGIISLGVIVFFFNEEHELFVISPDICETELC